MKVAIIGAGDVGANTAQRIAEADLANVAIVDTVKGKAKACALDLCSASSIIRHSRTVEGSEEIEIISGSDIIVITAGQTRKPGQSREDLLSKNAEIVKGLSEKIALCCPGAIIIVVTNPVDVMTYLVYKTTGFRENQIIGMGGVSDCSRFNMLASRELDTASHHVSSIILGPHSDQMVIIPRLSTVLGIPITELLPENRIKKIIEETRKFGATIINLLAKGSAHYGPSAAVYSIVDSIINDRKSILCVCANLTGQYGIKDLCIGVPAKVGRMGIEEIIELKLKKEEKDIFLSSIKSVKKSIQKLGV